MTTIAQEVRPWASDASAAPALTSNPARRGPIVLALDGSASAQAAIAAARALAERLDLPLNVVTVVEPWPYYTAAVGMWPMPMPAEDELRQVRARGLRQYIEKFMAPDEWSLEVRVGQPASEIRRYARELNATVIVMPAEPHRHLGHTISGVRAAQVLRGATCPVLSVAPSFTTLPHTLVAAMDFSPASIRAAQAALLFAADDATLSLVHVLGETRIQGQERMYELLQGQTGRLFDRVREELAPFTPSLLPLETREMQGEVVPQLLQCAESLGADLIAVGTHGPGFVERMFLGSVAANTLHLARCSVLASPVPPATDAVNMKLHVHGTATMTSPNEWVASLDAVSRRNAGRLAALEVDDREIGAQIEANGYTLQGITYDAHDQRIAIMLEGPAAIGHVTRSIGNVKSISVTTAPDGRDRALSISHGHGQTLLFLSD